MGHDCRLCVAKAKHLSLARAAANLPRCGNLTMANCCTHIEILSKLLCSLKVQFYCFAVGGGRGAEEVETARSSCWSDNVCSAAAIGNKPRPICTRTMNPCGALCHIKRKCTRRRGQAAAAAQAAVQEQQQQWQHHRARCCCHFCWRLATLSTAVAAADVVTASCCM